MGNELTLPDIAWFIYVSRLKAARYPIHILHPNVNDWYESLLKEKFLQKKQRFLELLDSYPISFMWFKNIVGGASKDN